MQDFGWGDLDAVFRDVLKTGAERLKQQVPKWLDQLIGEQRRAEQPRAERVNPNAQLAAGLYAVAWPTTGSERMDWLLYAATGALLVSLMVRSWRSR